MIDLLRDGQRLTVWVEGTVDYAVIEDFIPRALIATEELEQGEMLIFIEGDDWPSLGAIALEMLEIRRMLQLVRRFDRIAVVTDKDWLGMIAEIEGRLIPGLEIESFDFDEVEDADEWLVEPVHEGAVD